MTKTALIRLMALLAFVPAGCGTADRGVVLLKHLPVDSTDGVVSTEYVCLDSSTSSDGAGSLRIDATESTLVHLYMLDAPDIEKARLIYRADIKTRDAENPVYLEMYCVFNDKGAFFSRDLQTPLLGNNDWTTEETPFFLRQGENPDSLRLNLVIAGAGTVWIDNIRLLKAQLD
jgi:hypothetical protein